MCFHPVALSSAQWHTIVRRGRRVGRRGGPCARGWGVAVARVQSWQVADCEPAASCPCWQQFAAGASVRAQRLGRGGPSRDGPAAFACPGPPADHAGGVPGIHWPRAATDGVVRWHHNHGSHDVVVDTVPSQRVFHWCTDGRLSCRARPSCRMAWQRFRCEMNCTPDEHGRVNCVSDELFRSVADGALSVHPSMRPSGLDPCHSLAPAVPAAVLTAPGAGGAQPW